MVHEVQLSAVLADFARTLTTDFPIQRILDHLIDRIVEVLPVTAAGVTLIAPGTAPRYVAASDASALRFEQLQARLGQGPCVQAYETGEAVTVADLREDDRFPQFAAVGAQGGMRAMFAFPLRHGEGCLGALDLYRDAPGELNPGDMSAAQTLADVAAAYLLNAQAREELRATSDLFRDSAQHDALTGLPNRVLLQQRLEHAVQRARRSPMNVAVLFVDLDDFKRINDTYGHRVGDDLLIAAAGRLSDLVREGDTLSRFAGDEFVFFCEDVHSQEDAMLLAKRIETAFSEPFVLPTVELAVTASVGLVFAGPDREISTELIFDADVAMYQAKRRGGGAHQLFDLKDGVLASDRRRLETDLRAALRDDQLAVAYQPIVRSTDGLVTGVEALLRWTDTRRGPVAPLSMVAIAEQCGLIGPLGAWVLERSCQDHARWLAAHPGTVLDLAVNVSARQLMSANFTGSVAGIIARTGMDPASLILEITENIFIEDSTRASTVLRDLRALGVRLALDDFGTGFSSLDYLRRLPIDIVKIDQCFVADIGHAAAGVAIVEAVTRLAHALGLSVTAEGVETVTQRDEIRAIGCEFSQGYFFARPMTAAAFSAQLGDVPPAFAGAGQRERS